MSSNLSLIRVPALVAATCAAAAGFAPAAAHAGAAPIVRATRYCEFPNDGSAYPTSTSQYNELRVTNVTCGYALKFLKPYWRCRTAKSIKGECKRVKSFRCTEGRRHYQIVGGKQDSYAVRVTCRRGTQRIVLAYSQSLNGTT